MDWFLYDNGLCHEKVKSTCLNKKSDLFRTQSNIYHGTFSEIGNDWVLNKPLKMETI